MSDLIRTKYNPIMQVHKTALRCGKCGLCRFIDNTKIENIRFSYICPSGARFRFEEYWGSGKSEIARGLITQLGATTMELDYSDRLLHALYTCTLCGGCQKMCEPIGKEPLKTIVALREKAVIDEAAPLTEHKKLIESILKNGNPWNRNPREKGTWTQGLKLKDMNVVTAKVLYFTGCFPLNQRLAANAANALKILGKIGLDVGVLGATEKCCGAAILKIGDRENFERYAKEHINLLNSLDIELLIASCSSCFNILRDEYPEIGDLNFEVKHITEVISEAVDKGTLKLEKEVKLKAAYHDPCTLGRYSGIYDEPREILSAIPGLELVEMYRNRENAWCCGAGGGGEVAAQYPDYAKWVASERIEEARAVGANAVITACPFCEDTLGRAGGGVEVMDIVEVVSRAV